MALKVRDIATQAVTALGPVLPRICKCDRSLGEQIKRAAASVLLNIAEAEASDPGTQKSRLFSAAGSAREVRAAIVIVIAWRYVPAEDLAEADALFDRTGAMLFRLLRPRRPDAVATE